MKIKYHESSHLIIIIIILLILPAMNIYAAEDISPATNKKNVEKIQKQDNSNNDWAHMKNYRVWEANKKEFQYPENWIEPASSSNSSKNKLP